MNQFGKTIKYLESFIPKEADLGKSMDLSRIKILCDLLGNPQNKYPVIHVGGTSGKGSTATFTSEILKHAGLKVGLHLSPHLETITERFQINNRQITSEDLVVLVGQIRPYVKKIEVSYPKNIPTYFEILVAAAFYYFALQKVDAAVVEVGLGGKLDATNIIPPAGVILTNISLDHTAILGRSVSKIFADKSEIIKPGAPFVVSGILQHNLRDRLITICGQRNVPLYMIDRDFKIEKHKLALAGEFQQVNFALAQIAANYFLKKFYPQKMKLFNLALNQAAKSAFIPGRLEIISKKPLIILDGAHNKAKMTALVNSIKILFPYQKFITIFAVKKDKSYKTMFKLLNPITHKYVLTQFTGLIDVGQFQALNPKKIARGLTKPHLIDKNPHSAVKKALQISKSENLPILITGSLYLVGEIRKDFMKLPRPYGRGFVGFASSGAESLRSGLRSTSHDLTIGVFREGG